MLERDVANITAYLGRFAPELLDTRYAKEIWELYKSGELNPEVELTGRFERIEKAVDVDGVIQVVDNALKEEAARQLYRQQMTGQK
jgi:RIO kinase 1